MNLGDKVIFCGTEKDLRSAFVNVGVAQKILEEKPIGTIVDIDTFCRLNMCVEFKGITQKVWLSDEDLTSYVEKKKGKKK
ncbi:hypothetical protein [Zhenhengia yiwuensis]|uniref:Uncharacterized protein n=1 Tax=Zhenhengia yiwuensis TaxID=2763666 RepID=A0A926IE25_9FIRM|nr:hypothetical protein [Zhenhengia yiwuensis]MBC8579156.1 hypothetical protein [Zhenhengia yiwuensis]